MYLAADQVMNFPVRSRGAECFLHVYYTVRVRNESPVRELEESVRPIDSCEKKRRGDSWVRGRGRGTRIGSYSTLGRLFDPRKVSLPSFCELNFFSSLLSSFLFLRSALRHCFSFLEWPAQEVSFASSPDLFPGVLTEDSTITLRNIRQSVTQGEVEGFSLFSSLRFDSILLPASGVPDHMACFWTSNWWYEKERRE